MAIGCKTVVALKEESSADREMPSSIQNRMLNGG
jgi:hypothetical protein